MLNIKIEDKVYSIKNQINEFYIGEFEDLMVIMNDKINYLDKWSSIFIKLGIPEYVIDNMDTDDFIKIIDKIEFDLENDIEITNNIEIDNQNYVYNFDEVKINVKEMRLIEDFIVKDNQRYLSEIMAILYKNEKCDKNINFDLTHIKHKAKLFKDNVTIDKCIPFIKYLSIKIVKDFKAIENEFKATE